MKVGALEVVFHRTVRVADGRVPSNLPPSLGTMKGYNVSEYKDKCPPDWDEKAVFVALHDTEALWLSFRSNSPVALLVGAGGLNALTGQKLGTKLEAGNYVVAPPQPWLDGWKSDDGSVYQFIATPYQKGEGLTVAEQVIGAESKSGAIGLAVFEPKEPLIATHGKPTEGYNTSPHDDGFTWTSHHLTHDSAMPLTKSLSASGKGQSHRARALRPQASSVRAMEMSEMGIGKGGKIRQKIYPDPYGLEVWKDTPTSAIAVYVVNAEMFEAITGEKIPKPVGHESYSGMWFGLQDTQAEDISGSDVFTGLKTAFIGDTSNVVKE